MPESPKRPLSTSPPFVTIALLSGMLLVSVATLFDSRFYGVLGGVGASRYPWQHVTFAFEHGWPGMPLLPHHLGNVILKEGKERQPMSRRPGRVWRCLSSFWL